MRAVLKRIGRRSPFAHWRLFLKGCAAHYANKPGEAERCFARLPASSAPARKAEAFKVLQGDWQTADESAVAGASVLAGEPKLAAILSRAQRAWTTGRYLQAYNLLDRATSRFSTLQVTAWGQLTHFFQLADLEVDDRQKDRWLGEILEAKAARKTDLNVESCLVSNIIARHLSGCRQLETVDEFWPHFVRNREMLLGRNARFTGLCHFARAIAEDPEPGEGGSPFSPFLAEAGAYHTPKVPLDADSETIRKAYLEAIRRHPPERTGVLPPHRPGILRHSMRERPPSARDRRAAPGRRRLHLSPGGCSGLLEGGSRFPNARRG